MKLRAIADMLTADLDPQGRTGADADPEIVRVAKIEEAGPGDITFIANLRYAKYLAETRASAVIIGRDLKEAPGPGQRFPVLLRTQDPYVAFLKTLVTFHPPADPLQPGIHPTAVVAPTATLGTGVRVGARAVVGDQCRIGEGTMIGHGSVLADGVEVGSHSLVYHNVTVREGCRLGNRVIVQPGAVIGSDGFGFAPKPDGTYEKIPQVGIVVIEDDVEIGANTTIDRATMGETRVRKGAKLDNLIQVAHNVVVGENTVIAAQVGISGSTKIGAGCMIGGQVGFAGHIEIADGVKIGAQSGIHRSITEPGASYFGYPAVPMREATRVQMAVRRLPDTIAEIRELKARVAKLEEELQRRSPGS